MFRQTPNPFLFDNGEEVKSVNDWEKRRKEIYKTAVELQYGTMPPKPEFFEYETLYEDQQFNYHIVAGPKDKPVHFLLSVFKPAGEGKFPVVVDGDLGFRYPFNNGFIKTFTDNGICFAVFNRTELAPDRIWSTECTGQLKRAYPEYTFGAIGAWAWGYSRVVDVLETLDYIDTDRIAFTGHSRGGKTALLAGVLDERASIVNPNETCAGGGACYRLHIEAIQENGETQRSETLADLLEKFTSWVGPELIQYADKEDELPFDSHYLKALVAPRTLFVSEAASDIWGNPIGSWQTTMAANEVYKLYGKEENLLWYYRNGYHYHELQDIEMLVNVIKNKGEGEPLKDNYFKLPFKKPELMFDWKCPTK